jgi:ATP-dependent Clp protease ATP-binding subunit ClpC
VSLFENLAKRAGIANPSSMAPELTGTLTRARDLAQRRRQQLSTAHVLVALFQEDGQVAALCARLGLSEATLLGALNSGYEEHPNGIDLAVERAQKLAAADGANAPSPLHLLFSLIREPRSAASIGLQRAGLSPELVTGAARGALSGAAKPAAAPVRSPASGERSQRSRRRQRERFGSLRLSEETESKLQRGRPLAAVGGGVGVDEAPAEPLAPAPQAQLSAPAPSWRAPARLRAARNPRKAAPPAQSAAPAADSSALDPQRFPLLCALGRDLSALARSGAIDPVIGRDQDIDRLLDVLARRRGNNPLLVGAPGVGKTAIVEGLALAMVRDPGEQRILLEISASSLIAGTSVRGALSERIQTLRREVADSAGRVLVFIDEIHTVLAGSEAEGLGNELKTALARGELPVIGATTDAEYRRVFERDAALARRFTRIEVSEPSRSDALAILRALAPKYALHHGVEYDAAALSAAVELSVRYLPLRQLPDKAIALLDQAAARTRRRNERHVDERAVANVVSELASVPVERLLLSDREALLQLEAQLEDRVLGQTRAAHMIAAALRKSAAGFRGRRPLGTFLLLGPTGVGKTEMARAISELLFPGIPLTRVDMSELGQAHAVARLFGSPPGYIGHEDGGQLTEAVRHRPYQLILLDEIEKAHLDVLMALLPLLDEGRLTDGRGRTVDFTNTVIVMTSNLGAEGASARPRIGFGEKASADHQDQEARALSLVRAALPPELFNRIDEPLYFAPLSESSIAEIARRMLESVGALVLAQHGVTVEIDASAIPALLSAGGFDSQLGARPMRRTVGRLVEAELARALLAHELVRGDSVRLRGVGSKIELQRRRAQRIAAES